MDEEENRKCEIPEVVQPDGSSGNYIRLRNLKVRPGNCLPCVYNKTPLRERASSLMRPRKPLENSPTKAMSTSTNISTIGECNFFLMNTALNKAKYSLEALCYR
ncbi:hypothetical protein J6590_005534 [Homalodisca vitripennis]|nr:hypothetical protein J6590_005534 [Homalodisca vitripennis]